MSSLQTSFSQVPANTKFLIALASTATFTPDSETAVKAVMTADEFNNVTSSSTVASGAVLRDMGKGCTVLGDNQLALAVYRLVQLQKGASTEGVPVNYTTDKFYVRVWSADYSLDAVNVARLG